MTPDKLEKIRRLALDTRGDPAVRAIAVAAYRRYAGKDPEPDEPKSQWKDTRHEGVKTSAEYDQFRFLNLGLWKKSAKGNPYHTIVWKKKLYHFTIFHHKKTPTYGWVRNEVNTENTVFSGRFSTLAAAHADAWQCLKSL